MKYGAIICQLSDCPPKDAVAKNTRAYRFVFQPFGSSSFSPQGVKKPARVDSELDTKNKCSLLALSFFTTQAFAELRFKSLEKSNKKIRKTLGSHIAEGNLDPSDGVQTPPCPRSGHFDLHESGNTVLESKFTVVAAL